MGGYETLLEQPAALSSNVDFVLFTDVNSPPVRGDWNVVQVPPRFPNDQVRSARYLKTIGHPILDEYDETVWIDNRVVLREPFEGLFSLLDGVDIALPIHSYRSTVRDECSEVVTLGYDDPERVRAAYRFVVDKGFEYSQPLWTGLMVRKRNDSMRECMRLWMDYILLMSRRDQLSINVALHEAGVAVRTYVLDNSESEYHRWAHPASIGRRRRVQQWHASPRGVGVCVADAIRSLPRGHTGARVLEELGIPMPTLPKVARFK